MEPFYQKQGRQKYGKASQAYGVKSGYFSISAIFFPGYLITIILFFPALFFLLRGIFLKK